MLKETGEETFVSASLSQITLCNRTTNRLLKDVNVPFGSQSPVLLLDLRSTAYAISPACLKTNNVVFAGLE